MRVNCEMRQGMQKSMSVSVKFDIYWTVYCMVSSKLKMQVVSYLAYITSSVFICVR